MLGIAIGQGIGPFGGFVPTWTPKSLSGCVSWYRSDLGTTVTPGVQRWLDLSGNLNHLEQVQAARRPSRYGTAIECVRADVDRLERSAALSAVDNGYTIGMAVECTSLPGAAGQDLLGNGGSATGQTVNTTTLRRMIHYGASAPSVINWGTATTDPETWVFRHTGATNLADFALDGAHQSQQALTQNLTPSGLITLGMAPSGARASDARFWSLIAYSNRLSDADTVLLSTYLTAIRNGTTLPSWRPTDVAGLVIWLERADQNAGEALSDWADQSGTSRDLAQATVNNQPVLIPAGGPNSLPCLSFDGTNDKLAGTWTQAQPTHVFAAMLPSRGPTANCSPWDGATGNSRRLYNSGATGTALNAYAGANLATNVIRVDAWQRVEVGYNGASSRIRRNDTVWTGNVGTAAGNGLWLGVYGTGTSAYADMDIAEWMEFNRILTSAEQTQVHDYLTARYGI